MVGWRNVSWFRSNLWPVTLLNILKILEVPQSGVLHFSTRELIELTRYEESTINLFLMNLHVWSLNQKLYSFSPSYVWLNLGNEVTKYSPAAIFSSWYFENSIFYMNRPQGQL